MVCSSQSAIFFPSYRRLLLDLLLDSLLDPDVSDYSNLCPFCDQDLPSCPSAKFNKLLLAAKERARPEPRQWNPNGLRAALPEYITVCRQHEIEGEVLPRGREEGWPWKIDWRILEARVMERKALLQPIVAGIPGGKEKSSFWNTLQESIKDHGGRKALDTKREASSFGGNQAG